MHILFFIQLICTQQFYDCDQYEPDCAVTYPPSLIEILPTDDETPKTEFYWPGPWDSSGYELYDVESPFSEEPTT